MIRRLTPTTSRDKFDRFYITLKFASDSKNANHSDTFQFIHASRLKTFVENFNSVCDSVATILSRKTVKHIACCFELGTSLRTISDRVRASTDLHRFGSLSSFGGLRWPFDFYLRSSCASSRTEESPDPNSDFNFI